MTILLVDTDAARMRQTAALVQNLLPDAEGLSTTDPLLAAKYAFDHPVDLLIAGVNMKRMNGIQLSAFLQEKNAGGKVCLFGTRQEMEQCPAPEQAFFRLLLPIREPDLREILNQCRN